MNAHNSKPLHFIDTNIFLRVFIKENETMNRDCIALLHAIEQKKIKAFTSSVVVAEIHHVMTSVYHVDKNIITNALKSIMGISNLSIVDDMDVSITLSLFTSYSVKFTDCLIASSKILQNNGVIVSYDKDFDKLKIKRVEPQEI
jgi:predicted nucleic acid-binding protein